MARRGGPRTAPAGGAALSSGPVTELPKLLVIGATRGTGRQVLRQALAAGHPVVALARDPARLDLPPDLPMERLCVVRGDVLDPASLAPAMAGRDAVISTIGVASRGPTTLYSAGMRNIIQAMGRAGVRRLVAVSASPLSDDTGDVLLSRLLLTPLIRALLRPVYDDMARMEEAMRRSGLDWTILRPPRLIDRPRTGRYRTARDRRVRGGRTIGRADLADAIHQILADPATIHAAIDVAY
jgi:putative NADH-flavin reductase